MKMNKYIILLFLCLGVSSFTLAQNNNELVLKKMKLNILEKVELFSLLSGVSNDDEKDEFFRLFTSDSVLINNDIMPDNNLMQKLNIKEYADLIPKYFTNALKITVRPYDIGMYNLVDSNSGEFWVDAKKYISGVSKKGIQYTDNTFDIRFTFRVSYHTGEYKISDITLNKQRGRYLVITNYKKGLFKKKVLSLDTMLIKNKQIMLNENGQYLILDFESNLTITPYSDIYYGSYNLTDKQLNFALNNKENENNIDLFFRKSVLFFEPIFSFNPFSIISPVNSNNDNIQQSNIFSYTYGLNFGYSLYAGKKGNWNLKTGFSSSNLNYSISIKNKTDSYILIDADQSNYIRTNQVYNLIEKHELQYFSIPLNLEKDFNFKDNYSLYINTGASLIFELNGNRNTETNAVYSGFYKDLFGLTIKENGVYDFGTFRLNKSSSLNTVNNLIAFDFGMGISKKINRRTSARLGFIYQKSLENMFNKDPKRISTNQNELFSITQTYNDFTINLFLINLGLKYNL